MTDSITYYFIVSTLISCVGIGFAFYGVSAWVIENKGLIAGFKDRLKLERLRAPSQGALIREDRRFESLDRFLTPKNEVVTTRLSKRLLQAGYRSPSAVRLYYGTKWGIAVAGSLVLNLVFFTMQPFSNAYVTIACIVAGSLASVFATDEWIGRRIQRRKLAIEYGFPDALDLLLVCIEAGQSMDQAITRVARELRRIHPVLAEELSILVGELSAGKIRATALGDFAERTDVASVVSFVTVLKQSDAFGVSIAESLRVYSRDVRDKRFMNAEERANMMPVKLTLATTLLTMYPLLAILVGPAFIALITQIQKTS